MRPNTQTYIGMLPCAQTHKHTSGGWPEPYITQTYIGGWPEPYIIYNYLYGYIYAVYIRYYWQGNYQIDGQVRRISTVLANPRNLAWGPGIFQTCAADRLDITKHAHRIWILKYEPMYRVSLPKIPYTWGGDGCSFLGWNKNFWVHVCVQWA